MPNMDKIHTSSRLCYLFVHRKQSWQRLSHSKPFSAERQHLINPLPAEVGAQLHKSFLSLTHFQEVPQAVISSGKLVGFNSPEQNSQLQWLEMLSQLKSSN